MEALPLGIKWTPQLSEDLADILATGLAPIGKERLEEVMKLRILGKASSSTLEKRARAAFAAAYAELHHRDNWANVVGAVQSLLCPAPVKSKPSQVSKKKAPKPKGRVRRELPDSETSKNQEAYAAPLA